ncbi:MAG: 1-(5-phosphoribosyl)-5-[(5-phosphoribosylamino)methylideneamino]imidazole-4-carboxamide isomerase [Saprospiraceae bacterium]|nr:1-(5-phosphoribosyl)-5-[(5-phosphoribosylamino)methylideneamino]imidazole-4-carboxamide isomerase [Saprospiraceae bacterium]|tara:strand:+ start:126 stop:845 length:720 start_codon:yes stop_codon:yes gene_type:complete
MRIIPAIDIIDGKCVRLTQGDYNQKKIYDESPVHVAMDFEKKGIKYLHLVDLDGAKANEPKNLVVLNSITVETSLKVDFGGGIKNRNSLLSALTAGAEQVNIGSLAVRNTALVKFWINQYGRDKIIISADVKDGKIAVSGWKENSDRDLMEFIDEYVDNGAKYFVCTDISKDGMLEGSSIEMYKTILENFPRIKLVASGGVTTLDEIYTLRELGCDGAIIGKAIYEGHLSIEDLVNEMA